MIDYIEMKGHSLQENLNIGRVSIDLGLRFKVFKMNILFRLLGPIVEKVTLVSK